MLHCWLSPSSLVWCWVPVQGCDLASSPGMQPCLYQVRGRALPAPSSTMTSFVLGDCGCTQAFVHLNSSIGPVFLILGLCAVYSSPAVLYIITGLYSTGLIRVNVGGLLTLQTLPTREAFVASQTLYISLGAIALALGGLSGASISINSSSPNGAIAWFLGISGTKHSGCKQWYLLYT